MYQDEKNFFAQFAIDHTTYRQMYPEFLVPDDQWQAFEADKQGAIAGEATAKRFGWKVGDRIPIKGAIFPGDWEFNLVGIYKGARPADDLTQFWFRWDHLTEKAPEWAKGFVGWYTVRVEPGADAVAVTKDIDSRFANSPWETRTQSEQAFMASFVEQMGNIGFLMTVIGSVVFFTLLLVAGNTMAMSVRERTGELAVLKTVGFTDRAVLLLVLVEVTLIAVAGGRARHPAGQALHPARRPHGRDVRVLLPAALGHGHGRRPHRPRRPAGRPHPRHHRHAPPGGAGAAQALMALPLVYNLESVRARWRTTIVAILGIAGTVGVFVAMLALAKGFQAALVTSGDPDNAFVRRAGRHLGAGQRDHPRAAPPAGGRGRGAADERRAAGQPRGGGDGRPAPEEDGHRRQRRRCGA